MTGRRPTMKGRRPPVALLLFAVKATNTVLATAWTFLLAYALVRLVGLGNYAFLAGILALAALVLQFDLGISIRLFGRLRQDFLAPHKLQQAALGDAVVATFWCYAGVALAVTAIFATAIWGAGLGNPDYRLANLLLFLGAVMPLPWMVLRAALNACDRFLLTELVDFLRRAVLLVLTGALVAGMPLLAYAIAFPLLWLAGLAVLWVAARRIFGSFGLARWRPGLAVLRADIATLGASAALALAEFLIYIHPYYAIPAMGGDAVAVVAFDMFYKVTRFAVTAYLTVTDTLLPQQTKAFHAGDAPALRRGVRLAFLLGAIPASGAAAVILVFGHELFGLLLGRADVVSPGQRWIFAAMLGLMLVQTVCGGLLAALGVLAPLARRASATLGAMLVFVALATVLRLPFIWFLAGYVALYAVEALSYLLVLRRLLISLGRPAAGAGHSSGRPG